MKKQLFRSSRYSQSASLLVGSQGIFPQAGPSLWYVITECCFAAYQEWLAPLLIQASPNPLLMTLRNWSRDLLDSVKILPWQLLSGRNPDRKESGHRPVRGARMSALLFFDYVLLICSGTELQWLLQRLRYRLRSIHGTDRWPELRYPG